MESREYKLVVLGSGGVGKSALVIRLVTDNFLEDYDPTIVEIDQRQALLDILDTAGQEEYTTMQDEWMREGKGFLLVYSVTSQTTFDEIKTVKDKILRAKDINRVPLVLVGNKCDLDRNRQVSLAAGKALAAEWGCPFMETSAKERIRNEECFFEVVREIRKQDAAKRPAPKSNGTKKKVEKKGGFCSIL
ncbi:hypothetical protein DYB37_002754 [Aphanomyces astaci]|uniref:small monomeric GTPase n=1 Tax=Aphanomyces astaci TaxID=112090 RepID=A0A397BTF5_APHAT|nr:hypothetical protein DYB36_001269 [Aphanomyces astaci]RHY23184.1 hypothetical protein DYB25_006871 [Aphanomyces astaci]RHY56436.1 hypothetical protein DYB30_001296 [Aphanomyces astaci]RHY57832.1 hypothetical protein DYB38_003752 [Aphanomyces astaci]RHY58134.1 hypothetical protein DYB34_003710 [Aphanomyces astaci]